MIVGKDVKTWISDRPRQRATLADMAAFARDWEQGAVHRRFREAFDSIEAPTAEKVADTASALFADESWVDALIDGLAARMRADPFFDPPFRQHRTDIYDGLLVFEHELVSIAAGVSTAAQLAAKKTAPRGPTSVGFTGHLGVFKYVKAGGALLSFWEVPPITAGFTAADAGQCVRTGEREIADGEILVIDGRHQSFVIERARSNLVILQATIAPDRAPLCVEYDSASRGFVGCSATHDTSSRIQMITTLLRKLDCDAALPAMVDLLDHPDFFVRWHVMKELLGLDAGAALPHLRRMAASDPHPDPRRAARAVLDRFEAPAAKRQAA
ncbi:MAG TPA: HEAT repeat domain-containing protein [Allosphingosinicella sp.]|nr:HEAT repeat domain-containing protein [Allosphingosinicella sp.]